MNGTTASPYPPGDMRVSDADRDRAVSELTAAYQARQLRHEEFTSGPPRPCMPVPCQNSLMATDQQFSSTTLLCGTR